MQARKQEQVIATSPYVYKVQVDQLLAGEVVDRFITIQPDSNFLARSRIMSVNAAVAPGVVIERLPQITVEVIDTASGRNLTREPVMAVNNFGSAKFPYLIPLGGKIFYKRQIIQVRIRNIGIGPGSGIGNLSLEWHGEKIFTTS